MRSTLILALLSCSMFLTPYRSSLAQEKRISKPASVAAENSDRELDGLTGPVRRIRVEIAKISVKDGKFTEGPRILRETTTYDPKGRKIDSVAHPVEGSTLPGKEEYRYDDNGNIVEMVLRGDDGSILSKETYKYELDEMGNWKKMTSSVAIYEDGKVFYEPVEITYRTISYYFSQAVDKLVASNPKPDARVAKNTVAETASITPAAAVTTPPKTSEKKASTPVEKRVETSTGGRATETATANKPIETATASKPAETNSASKATETPLERVTAPTSTEVSVANASDQPKVTDKVGGASSEKLGSNTETGAGVNSTLSQPTEPAKAVDPPTEKVSTNNAVNAALDSATKPTTSAPIPTTSAPRASTPTVPERAEPEKTAVPKEPESTTAADPATSAYEKGLSHLAALRYADAAKSFNESVRLNPNNAQVYVKLGVAYSSQGQYTEAVAVLKMAIQIKREVVDAQGYYHLATAYAALGKNSNALEAFKQALYILRAEAVDQQKPKTQNAPPMAHVHHGIGAMYYNLERYNDAIKELKRAIELNPKLSDAYYVLALSYLAVGNRKSAEGQRDTLRSLNSALARKIDTALSKYGSGLHCRTVFGPCQ